MYHSRPRVLLALSVAILSVYLPLHTRLADVARAQSLPDPPVCERTPVIRDAILSYAESGTVDEDCENITSQQLASIASFVVNPSYLGEELTELAPTDFNGLTGVRELSFFFAPLTSLPTGVFSELTGLEMLSFNYIRLASITAGLFNGLTNLRVIVMEGHNLTDLPDGLLSGLDRLESFILTGETVPYLKVPIRLTHVPGSDSAARVSIPLGAPFDLTIELRSENAAISLDGNQVNEVTIATGDTESETFNIISESSDDGIVEIILPRMPTTECGEDWTRPCYSGFRFVDADAPPITPVCDRTHIIRDAILNALPSETPVSCQAVTEWQLENIPELIIDSPDAVPMSLSTGDLDGISSLQILNIQKTALTSFDPGFFSPAKELKQLYIDSGTLSSLSPGMFESLKELITLRMARLDLGTLPPGLFDGLNKLQELDLAANRLETLPDGLFNELGQLRWLVLYDNNLTALPEDAFAGLANLLEVDLSYNEITSLPEGAFDGLHKLRKLKLQGNNLTSLPEDAFAGLVSLQEVDLSGNEITALPEGAFDGLRKLRKLKLQGNSLTSLPEGAFAGLVSLQEVDLSDNEITTLPDRTFEGVTELKRYDLHQIGEFSPLPIRPISAPVRFVPTHLVPPKGKVVFSIGAPFELKVGIAVTGGTAQTNGETIESVTIPPGATDSPEFRIALDPEATSYSVELTPPTVPTTLCESALLLPSPCFGGLQIAVEQPDEVILPETGGYAPNLTTLLLAVFAGVTAAGTGFAAATRPFRHRTAKIPSTFRAERDANA